MTTNLQRWHQYAAGKDLALLEEMVHENAVFFSPVVHTPQRGKALVMAYLSAAFHVFQHAGFEYVREFDCGSRAVLEFAAEMDGIQINGADLIEWDKAGLIVSFKVMVRPLKAVQMVHAQMGRMLEEMKQA